MKSLVTLICFSVATFHSHSFGLSPYLCLPPSILLYSSLSVFCLCFSFNLVFRFSFFVFVFSFRSLLFLPPFSLNFLLLWSSSIPLLPFFPPLSPASLSASLSLVDQTVEAAKLPEARADRGAALSDLPPSPERDKLMPTRQ